MAAIKRKQLTLGDLVFAMKLPNASNALTVGRWRHIQLIHGQAAQRNPDDLVGRLLPVTERWTARWIRAKRLRALRDDRFYYYLVARTHYYDRVFQNAIRGGARQIINVGAGTDTRAYRFGREIERNGIVVSSVTSRRSSRRKSCCAGGFGRQRRSPISSLDLNDQRWPLLDAWLERNITGKAFVMMEELTPYVHEHSVGRFLDAIARRLPAGSTVAYDYKITGVDDSFGHETTSDPLFRLPAVREEVARFHEARNYKLTHMELSDALSLRILGDPAPVGRPVFRQDGLIQIELMDGPARVRKPVTLVRANAN